jgi:hypothetical protein
MPELFEWSLLQVMEPWGLGFFCSLLLCFAAASFYTCLFSSRLPGGGITFFAAAKKVIKESSFLQPDTAA